MSKELISVQCDECKHQFILRDVDVNEAAVIVSGERLVLTYFTCPKCNKVYRVTLKDARYDEIVVDIEKTKKRIQRTYGTNNEELARMLYNTLQRKMNRLKVHTEKLDDRFSGTFTLVMSENNCKLEYLP